MSLVRGLHWTGGLPTAVNTLDEVHLVDLPQFQDERGRLTFLESEHHMPFSMQRLFYIYDVPSGAHRAGHAHHVLQQLIIAISGSFTVVGRTPDDERRFRLFTPFQALYVPPLIWRDIEDFSSGSVALVVCSTRYDDQDYFEDFADYTRAYRRVQTGT